MLVDVLNGFAARPASVEWEFAPLPNVEGPGVWAWFKPAALPTGLSVSIPPETFAATTVTPRLAAFACGLPVEAIAAWSRLGQPAMPLDPASPEWDRPLAPPPEGVDPQLHFWVHLPVALIPASPAPQSYAPITGGTPATGDDLATLSRMDSDWMAIQHLERQLNSLRKQLTDMSGKLGSLNRDLSSDEKQFADRQDQNAWQDARRWLRDCGVKVSQCLKAQHIGDASDAGRRQWFQQIYDDHIAPRRTFDGLDAASREFEAHRKLVQTMQLQMSSALSRATQDGEQRARRVLSQIMAKRSRRNPGRK